MPKRKSSVLKENTKDGNSSKTEQAESVVYDHWLMKSEPESRLENGVDMKFSIDDLIAEPDSTACWDGVRNYQARNFLRDQMKIGQKAFFYHSNCKQPGIISNKTPAKHWDIFRLVLPILFFFLPVALFSALYHIQSNSDKRNTDKRNIRI